MRYETFEDWILEVEGMGTRSERCFESFGNFNSELGKQANILLWLRAAFSAARIEEGYPIHNQNIKTLMEITGKPLVECLNTLHQVEGDMWLAEGILKDKRKKNDTD